jgi:hypothetical protein
MPERENTSGNMSMQSALNNPQKALMLLLKQEFGVKYFVETGTHHGKTTLWASQRFERIYTVEGSQVFYEQTSRKLAHLSNIKFSLGSSREKLPSIVAELDAPAIFWLDAHWMGDSSTYDKDECPILEEIDVINSSSFDHFIFIDDARLFLSPPPEPLSIDGWPTIATILEKLKRRERYIVVFHDTIIAVPRLAGRFTADYCQRINTIALLKDKKEKNRLVIRTEKRLKRILYLCLARIKALLGQGKIEQA